MRTTYTRTIMEATGVNETIAIELEKIMRHEIFHSTLDWQTKDQLIQAAKEALDIYSVNN